MKAGLKIESLELDNLYRCVLTGKKMLVFHKQEHTYTKANPYESASYWAASARYFNEVTGYYESVDVYDYMLEDFGDESLKNPPKNPSPQTQTRTGDPTT